MRRASNKLSATAVEKRKKPGRLGDGGGLWLNIRKGGSKSWIFRWTPSGGVPREMGLGPYPAVSLAMARIRAQDCRQIVADGGDPKAERDKEAEPTFGECVEMYLASMERQWTNAKHRYQWRQTLTDYCIPIRKRKVSEIDLPDILKVLQPIWNEKTETASRLRGRLERVLNYAKVKGWRSGENPAMWRGNLENVLPKPRKLTSGHLPAMPYADVPAFLERLRNQEALAARALELLIFTVARTSEVLNAQWSEFDFETGIWTVPAERMKTRKEHRVPLTAAATEVLLPLHEARMSEWVFPGQAPKKPLSSMAMEMLLRRMKIENATVHGFRSSFRDWAGDQTSFPREVAEGCLAHNVGNEIERAYRRSDALEKRHRLMEAWADYCSKQSEANVIHLRK
jgi:integrase